MFRIILPRYGWLTTNGAGVAYSVCPGVESNYYCLITMVDDDSILFLVFLTNA